MIDYTANLILEAKIFEIWHHDRERRRTDNDSFNKYWRCDYCKKRKLFKIAEHIDDAINYAIRHLKNKHNIDVKKDKMTIPLQPSSLFNSIITAATATVISGVSQAVYNTAKTAKSLITILDMKRFYYLLIRWIVLMNICLIIVEHDFWCKMIIYIYADLASYLVKSENIIKQ